MSLWWAEDRIKLRRQRQRTPFWCWGTPLVWQEPCANIWGAAGPCLLKLSLNKSPQCLCGRGLLQSCGFTAQVRYFLMAVCWTCGNWDWNEGGGCLMMAIKLNCCYWSRWSRSDNTSYGSWRHVSQVHPECTWATNSAAEGKGRGQRVKGMLAPWTLAPLGRELNWTTTARDMMGVDISLICLCCCVSLSQQ